VKNQSEGDLYLHARTASSVSLLAEAGWPSSQKLRNSISYQNPDRAPLIAALEDGSHPRECGAPAEISLSPSSVWRNDMIKFKLLGALAFLSMLSLAQPPAYGGEGRQIKAPPWSAACMTD